MRKLWKWAIPACALGATVLLFRFVLFIGYVPTESMEPTIHKGSYILGCRIFGELKVGDIIVFEHEGKQVVKRIAAVSGDVMEHTGQHLTVPDGCFYVLGNNSGNSYDSRRWSEISVSKSEIRAKISMGRVSRGRPQMQAAQTFPANPLDNRASLCYTTLTNR